MAERCDINITRYRAVLFDMDGVISDTMPLHYEAWNRAFEPYGVKVNPMDVYTREGQPTTTMVKAIAEAKGRNISPEDLRKIVDEKSRLFKQMVGERGRLFDGVRETLRMLHNNGVKLALVTGSKMDDVKSVLAKLELEHTFDVIVSGDDIEKGKPSPDPYLKAIEKLGIPKLDCVVIENAPLGIKSAKAAGAGYIIALTTSLDDTYLAGADSIMRSFQDLQQCLARRFAAQPGWLTI